MEYGKIQIDGIWRRWEEDTQTLKDNKGKVWGLQGEGTGGEEEETG